MSRSELSVLDRIRSARLGRALIVYLGASWVVIQVLVRRRQPGWRRDPRPGPDRPGLAFAYEGRRLAGEGVDVTE